MKWIGLYSQTGSELKTLSKRLGREPDLVFTNNKKKKGWMTHDDIMEQILNYPDALITLHGYLRIIPALQCEKLNMYNGHPGLITLYPELKGKDPQERSLSYDRLGAVVHKVIEGVDEGDIIASASYRNTAQNIDEVYNICKHASMIAWLRAWKIFDKKVKDERNTTRALQRRQY